MKTCFLIIFSSSIILITTSASLIDFVGLMLLIFFISVLSLFSVRNSLPHSRIWSTSSSSHSSASSQSPNSSYSSSCLRHISFIVKISSYLTSNISLLCFFRLISVAFKISLTFIMIILISMMFIALSINNSPQIFSLL